MNTASQNLPHHLGVLQQKLQHPADYELALNYFLEEFAGDEPFVKQSDPEEAPHLIGAMTYAAAKALGKPAPIEQCRVFHLAKFKFYHGNGVIDGRVLLFFYFETLNTGLLALIPGVRAAAEVARFQLTGSLAGNPKDN